jgi:UrcA family protein
MVLLACAASHDSNATSSMLNSRQRLVTLADLDLSQPLDIKKLHRRISIAAREVCWTSGVVATLKRSEMQRCTADSIAHAIAELDVPQLTRYHRMRASRHQ